MSTYLEEFLSSNSLLPNEIRRNFELMRNLDTVSEKIQREITQLQDQYVKKYVRDDDRRRCTTISSSLHFIHIRHT